MFRMILYSQWKGARLIIALGTVAGFLLPILSVQGAGSETETAELLQAIQSWGVLYPVLAAALAVLLAILTWSPDHRGRHVHALSLPLPRWRYALLRFGAGLVLLTPAILAVLVGTVLATRMAVIPPGLQAYPIALTVRFALAIGVGYSIFFAISAGTSRTAGVLLGLVAMLVVVQIVAGAANVNLDLPARVQMALLTWPGPLAIFTGRWMLIDV